MDSVFWAFVNCLNRGLHRLKDFTDYTRRGGFLAVSMMTAGAKTARIELYGNSIALVGHSLDLFAKLILRYPPGCEIYYRSTYSVA